MQIIDNENTNYQNQEPGKLSFPHFTEQERLDELKNNPSLYRKFQQLNESWRKRFLDFMTGKKTLPLTYDPFFKKLFQPDIYPERLSSLISSILGTDVTVCGILPNEESLLPANSMLIMDILVQMDDGSIANVEIQKIPYAFPAERMSCYSSDLVLRQYSRVKGEQGRNFTYNDLKKVYTIIFFEQSPADFKRGSLSQEYVHYGKTIFNTHLNLELLQEYFIITLDVFRENQYSKEKSTQNAWLSLLTSETVDDLERLVAEYPWMTGICQDMADYLYKPEEVLNMFSEALRILDDNTAQYMVDEMKKEIQEKDELIAEKDKAIDAAMNEKNMAIAEKDAAINEKNKALAEIETLKAMLAEKNG